MQTSIKTLTYFCLLFALFTAPSLVQKAAAQGKGATSEIFPFEFEASYCQGELIHFSGKVHVQAHEVVDAKGGSRYVVSYNWINMVGQGSDGGSYRLVGTTNGRITTERNLSSGVYVGHQVYKDRLIERGTGREVTWGGVIHTTINANGDLTVDFDSITVEGC